ncbi:MAG: FIST signal transduction protein [Patescibacteria group bacterium]
MSVKTKVGVSNNPEAAEAGAEAARSAVEQLSVEPKAIIVLASPVFDQEKMLAGVKEEVPGEIPLVGCTTAGEILPSGPQKNSVAVLLIGGDNISFHPVKVENISKDMRGSGEKLGQELKDNLSKDLKGTFIFSDGLSGNGTNILRGLISKIGDKIPFSGGAAADNGAMEKTYQYFNNEVLTDAAVALGFGGEVSFLVSAKSGWKPVGLAKKITKAEGTIIKEIDGKPAFHIYEEAFGKEEARNYRKPLSPECITHPLGMKAKDRDEILVRTPLNFLEDDSILVGADVIEGAEVYLMVGTIADAQKATELTINELKESYGENFPEFIFVSECITRFMFFGEKIEEEFKALQKMMPGSIIFGFFSYGQYAPIGISKDHDIERCDPGFYEQSVALTFIG